MTWVSVGVAGASVATGMLGAKKTKKKAKKAARAQAEATYQQRLEEIRLSSLRQKQIMGEARASTFASGLLMTGTPATFVRNLELEGNRALDWQKRAAQQEKASIRAGAAGAGAGLQAAGIQGALSILGAAAGAYAGRNGSEVLSTSRSSPGSTNTSAIGSGTGVSVADLFKGI